MLYKDFMKHAKVLTDNAKITSAHRKVLTGVLHQENGTLTVTDSHRLYQALDVDGVDEDVVKTVTGRVINEKYPDVSRLIPDTSEANSTVRFNVKELHDAVDHIYNVAKLADETVTMGVERDHVYASAQVIEEPGKLTTEMRASYDVQLPLEEGNTFRVNAKYLLDALKMFKAEKEEEVTLYFYGKHRPFTIWNDRADLIALILPLRSY